MTAQTSCPAAKDYVRLIRSEVTPELSGELLDHLESCQDCWRTIGPLLESDTLLSGVATGLRHATPELLDRLLALMPAEGTGEFGVMNSTPADFTPAGHEPPVPAVIGHYRIERLLGRGGMGAVYLATDTRLDRPVALKILLPQFTASPVARERILREARSAARIADDHVVTVYEADERDGMPFIAMQCLQGESLEEHLRKKTEFSIDQVLRIAEEAAKGLAAAHALGLVHRDVKPGNIFLEAPSGRAKVLDFGLAKAFDAPTELTGSGTLIGTPAFMSPEQGRGKALDARTDLFSLGVVLYRLCAGKLPFEGANTMAILTALAVDQPKPVRRINPATPEPLARLIHDLLAKDPDERPQSAAEVVERVRRMRAGEPDRKKPRRSPLIAGGLFALFALVALGIIITIKNKDGVETKIEVPDGATVTLKDTSGKEVAAFSFTTNAEWEKSVAGLKGDALMAAVAERLKQLNPGFRVNALEHRLYNGDVIALVITDASNLSDIGPLRVLTGLKDLYFNGGFRNPVDISPLKGLKLTSFQANGCPIKDIAPLAGMPLYRAHFWGSKIEDWSPLRGMKLTHCNVGHSPIKDISVLKGMPLEELCLNLSPVEDLTPLVGAPLKVLFAANTKVTDITPIAHMPIEWLLLTGSPVKDYSPLRTLPLTRVELEDPKKHADILRSIPTLKTINFKPVREVLGEQP